MKVVFIHHAGYFGGSSRSLGLFLPYLKEHGVEPVIIAPPGTAADFFKKITPNVHVLDHHCFPLVMTVVGMKNNPFHFLRNLRMTKNIGKIKDIIKAEQPDLVHCNEWGMMPIAVMVKKMNIPVVMHARTMPDKRWPSLNNYTLNKLHKFIDHLVCITGSVHDVFTKVKSKTIVYNPVQNVPLSEEVKPMKKGNDQVNFLSLSAIHKTKVYSISLKLRKFLKVIKE